jgi:hypothetical protein
MKKLFLILFLLCVYNAQSQQVFVEPETGKKFRYVEDKEFVPATVKITGKNDKPAIAAKIIEILDIKGSYINPTVVKNSGHGKDGTYSYIYINGKYFNKVQFLDETEKRLRYIIDGSSNAKAEDALKACPSQLAALRSAYAQAKKLGTYKTTKRKVYLATPSTNASNEVIEYQETETSTPNINSNDFEIIEEPEQKSSSEINYGKIRTTDYTLNKKVQPTTYQMQPTVYQAPVTYQAPPTTYQTVSYVDECTVLKQKYPSMFELYEKTRSKKVFNSVNWSERLDLKRCATGKTYFGRNWGWIVPLAAGLVFTGIDAVSNDVNVIWGKTQNNNPGGIIHTEPQGGN